ncbi:MAG: helix-turn-helix domain-containing protein [Lachnospiraceae bacterium]|nr:helix-turn-helix domain-containing protein [Lachnospiraceae bacterium]
MERLIERGLLFDYYGGLLSEKNKRIYEACAVEDMSLSEIAEEAGISRQAVSETLRRMDEKLKGYEDELQLIAKSRRLEECVKAVREALNDKAPDKKKIDKLLNEIDGII